jgi:hypothetical protein
MYFFVLTLVLVKIDIKTFTNALQLKFQKPISSKNPYTGIRTCKEITIRKKK